MTGRIVVMTMTIAVLSAVASPALSASTSSSSRSRSWLGGRGHHLHRGSNGRSDVDLCSRAVAPGVAHCDAYVRSDLFGHDVRPAGPGEAGSAAAIGNNGAYDPAYLQSAYNAPSATAGAGQTVAVVDAFDAPNIESDLATYRSTFGLPACTTANGCFRKIDQRGGTNYPARQSGWEQEISLDVQMVSAICPSCHILLVEADDAEIENLGLGVNKAVALGANVVSNSYGAEEWASETLADASYYDHPGVAIVASSGDAGYGVNYPAASPNVVAVGGTNLVQANKSGTRKAIETAWSRAGSGCSAFEPKPAWQTDTGCARRTVADVSAVADPATGVWVYNTTDGGWEVFGGTSVSAPIIGALYALAGNSASSAEMGSYPYAETVALNDVVAGSNGTCATAYLCNGGPGYDGPTGLGTPNTEGAFKAGGSDMPPPPPVPDFSLAAAALAPIKPGMTATSAVTVAPRNGLTGQVSLSASVSPSAGLTAGFSASSMAIGTTPAQSSLSLAAHTGGTYKVTITASRGLLVRTASLTVIVNDFSIKVSPAKATVVRGKAAHFSVTLATTGALAGPVNLSVGGLRAHTTVAFARKPAVAPGSQTVTITTSKLDAPGVWTLRFRGVRGSLNHAVLVRLTVR